MSKVKKKLSTEAVTEFVVDALIDAGVIQQKDLDTASVVTLDEINAWLIANHITEIEISSQKKTNEKNN